MTITISKKRLRELLLAERYGELMTLCGSIDLEAHEEARLVMREKYGDKWGVITDADLQREAGNQ